MTHEEALNAAREAQQQSGAIVDQPKTREQYLANAAAMYKMAGDCFVGQHQANALSQGAQR